MNKTIVAVLGTVALFGLAACDSKSTTSFTDPGKPIVVDAGQQFTISLDANHTTGYSWELAHPPDGKVAALVSTIYVFPGTKPLPPGAGGTEVWTFAPAGKGETRLTLNYRRPWETNVAPIRTSTFTVAVR